jgi:hypothetical protein
MEKLNKFNCMTYLGAARSLGVSVWRLRYAVESDYVSSPSVVLKQRALFSPDQLEELKRHFNEEEAYRKGIRGEKPETNGEDG